MTKNGRMEAEVVCFYRLRFKVSMVGEERISSGINSKWRNEKNKSQSKYWMEWETDNVGQTSEENGHVYYNECVKQDVEESFYRERSVLYGGELEANRLKLPEKTLGVAIRLENNSG